MLERIAPLLEEPLIFGVFSQLKKGVAREYHKVQVKPFEKGETVWYQFTYVCPKKVLHQNFSQQDAAAEMARLLEEEFHQGVLYTAQHDFHLLAFGRLKIKTQAPTRQPQAIKGHDGDKNYILQPDGNYDFLVQLGVMNEQGRVVKAKYDKFRQINKYLELVAQCVDQLPQDRTLRIIDFGCGKSYLTFALYYYLVKMLGRKVEIIGLDLKEDVVTFCRQVAQELDYQGLTFSIGDIRGYQGSGQVDMVVTLHACDTATDDAIVQAMGWGAKIILTVPCCQHELFSQISNPQMEPITRHGILKERLSAMITDTIRGQRMEACGYQVSIMEFISMEHTPKNILIKGVRQGGFHPKSYEAYRQFAAFWQIHPYLERRLQEIGLLPVQPE